MIYRLIHTLICALVGVSTAYLVLGHVPVPDGARFVVGLVVTITVTVLLSATDPNRRRG